MNQNAYINVTATFLLIALIFFGIAGINSVDRLRISVENMTRQLKELDMRAVYSSNSNHFETSSGGGEVANLEFYDPEAESGGRLITAIASDTKNMNYIVNNDATVSMFWGKAMDALAERNLEDLEEFQPMLAESWTLSEDKMTYHVKLRKGILWHDFTDPVTGREWKNVEVTAHDFKFYVDVIKNEDVDAAPIRGYLMDMGRIDVINDYEFNVVWKKKYFRSMDITLSLSPLPRHLYHAYDGPFDGTKFNDDHERNRLIVGCGPYQFVAWDKGSRLIMKRFEKYYGTKLGIMPPIETLVYAIYQHRAPRLQALISGDIDADYLTPDQWINQAAKDKAFDETKGWLRKAEYPAFSYSYIGLNQTNPLFQDKRVRQALSHLVDRERIIKDVYFGLARSVTGPFPLNSPASDPGLTPYSFSVELAKNLLADAGWRDTDNDGVVDKDGKPFVFHVIYPNGSTTADKMLPIIKEDMAKAGVKMELQKLEWSVVVQRLEKKSFEACSLGWTSPLSSPDPYQLWHSSYADIPASSNHIGFRNPEADRLIEEIRVCFDTEKRNHLYHEFHRLIYDEAPYIFLFAPSDLFAIHKRYRNFRVFPSGIVTNILWVPKSEQLQVPGF